MNKKYFLRGLGVGIVITALVLCIAYRKYNSEETVVKRATELGMIFPKQTPDTLFTVSGTAVAVATETPDASEDDETDSTIKPTQTPEMTEIPTIKPTSTPEQKIIKSTRSIVIRDALMSESVAADLKKAGIIKDAEKFNKYLEESGMATKIRSGKYKVPVDADFEKIAKIITGGK